MLMNPAALNGAAASGDVAALIMSMLVGLVIGGILAYVLTVIPMWRIFTKAGERGWKALIPVYNTYILYKISWKPSMFWIVLIIAFVGSLIMTLCGDSMLLLLLGWLIYVAALVMSIILYYKLSKAFGHGAGYTVGLIFLWLIFLYIIAFGSSEYQGAQG